MFDAVKRFLIDLLEREAARVIAYASGAAVAGLLFVGNLLGIEFSEAAVAGIAAFAAVVATEAIRLLVWSQRSVDELVEEQEG